jgi:ABC-type cobalamin transport system permease subunit
MSADRRRRRALSENELLGVHVVLGAGVGLTLALAFGWPPLPHVTLGVVAVVRLLIVAPVVSLT